MVSKKDRWVMFDSIASTYDNINRWITFGSDIFWRHQMIKCIPASATHLVDVASGTMDVAIAASKQCPNLTKITALDMAKDMLQLGEDKCRKANIHHVDSMVADVHELPMASDCVDAITVAFGIRNFERLQVAFSEMHRALTPGAPLIILESCQPNHAWVRQLNRWYLKWWVQPIGAMLSGKKSAYSYLLESIESFHSPDELSTMLTQCGFSDVKVKLMMAGSVQLIHAVK